MRVVSLVPSVTETLATLGVEPVACTRFCERPDLRHVGGTKDPDIAAIVALAPDLVVLDDEENRRDDADTLAAAGLTLHVTHVRTVDDVAPTLAALGEAVGVALPPVDLPTITDALRLRAFVPIWRRPWMSMSADTYGTSLLARIGVDVIDAAPGSTDRYPVIDLADVTTAQPDVVLLPSEPYPFAERHIAEITDALGVRVHLVDGQDLFWWGTRTPAAIARLSDARRGWHRRREEQPPADQR
jgi:ABC-type Fe3+-hydroxamate transport system substrate-binding protein